HSSGSGGTGARTGAAAERRSTAGFAPSDVTYKSCGHGILDGKVNGCIHRHHRHAASVSLPLQLFPPSAPRSGCAHQSPTTSARSFSAPSNSPFSRVEDAAAVRVPDPLHEVDRVLAAVHD
uniref:Uncharacterized protein n=1 Tax=Oryza glumipatula TaxID=40148 RepID=A0A0D9ZRF2_9ORYZ